MDDIQQRKSQIDEQARLTKEQADDLAFKERQALADEMAETVRNDAYKEASRIENDAQK